MDIDLLSKMVKELILDNDVVVLPGMGAFVADMVPSTFSDKGYTINPPYRRLCFRPKPDEGDILVKLYADSNNVSVEVADRILRGFLSELKSVVHQKKTVILPGLGRLRATKENNLFFVPNADLDIYPEGFGLEPLSLKTHQETREEVAAAVGGLKDILEEPVQVEPSESTELSAPTEPETPAEPKVPETPAESETPTVPEVPVGPETPVEPEVPEAPVGPETPAGPEVPETPAEPKVPETSAEPETPTVPEVPVEPEAPSEPETPETPAEETPEVPAETDAAKPRRTLLKIAVSLTAAAAILLVALAVAGRMYPDWIDQFLYSAEELEIIKHI